MVNDDLNIANTSKNIDKFQFNMFRGNELKGYPFICIKVARLGYKC